MNLLNVPKTFYAAVLRDIDRPLVIEKLELPVLSKGQVLVRIALSGICRSQLMEIRGARGDDKWLPHLLGHEGVGVVLAIGKGVTKVKPGDQVIMGWLRGHGFDTSGIQLQSMSGGIVNAGPVTTFGTHSIVAENRLVIIPDGLPLDIAVLFGCALPTGAGMILNELQPESNSCIVVYGLGGIGLSALMAANLFSCRLLIAIDISQEKLDTAKFLGATHVINALKTDPVKKVFELTGGIGADYCVESAGRVDTIEQAFGMVRKKGGRCLFASHPESGKKIQIDPHDLISGKRIEGSWGGASCPDVDVPRLAKLYSEGKLPLKSLLGQRYRLDQVNEALEDLEYHRTFRPLLVMENNE